MFCPIHKMRWKSGDAIHKEHSTKYPDCKDYKKDSELKKPTKKKEKKLTIKQKVKGKIGEEFVESIWLDDKPAFLCINLQTGVISTVEELEIDDITYIPIQSNNAVPYERYEFSNQELKDLIENGITKQGILDEIKQVADHFLVNSKTGHTITIIDTLLSYCMEWIDLIHFPCYVGETGSGKSSNGYFFKHIGYRPLYSEDITAANIYQFLGDDEEGQGIIIQDEAQDLNQDRDKIKIYKNSYARGSKIPRIVNSDSSSRAQRYYLSFGLKVFCAEKAPTDKGLLERSVIIKMLEGQPAANIKRPTVQEKEKISLLRNKLLFWKLTNQVNGIDADIQTGLINRDSELWDDFLRVSYGTTFYEDAQRSVKHFVDQRHSNIANSLEAKLFRCIVYNVDDKMEINIREFWDWMLSDENTILTGIEDGKQSIKLDEFHQKISVHHVVTLIKDKFHGKNITRRIKGEDGQYHEFTFYSFDVQAAKKLLDKYMIELDNFDHPLYKGEKGEKGHICDPCDPCDPLDEHIKTYQKIQNHGN